MVTPGVAGELPGHVADLTASGMDVLRINCAFGGPAAWARVIENLTRTARREGRACRVLMDLAGPKPRTARIPGRLTVRRGMAVTFGVTLPEVIGQLRQGDEIRLDDGRIGGRVVRGRGDRIEVRITSVAGEERRLLNGKSINIPGRELDLPPLTAKDERDLVFATRAADIVALSFVRRPADVAFLQDRLRAAGREEMGMVVKIETREAYRRAPQLLRQAMRSRSPGFLVGRGDLGVELGFAEVPSAQERIVRLCRQAGMPSVIATGILSTMVDEGVPARAELVDAVAAAEADCVMLHGGPNVCAAVRFLGELLDRTKDKRKGRE
jgi:pyruvate kinase